MCKPARAVGVQAYKKSGGENVEQLHSHIYCYLSDIASCHEKAEKAEGVYGCKGGKTSQGCAFRS